LLKGTITQEMKIKLCDKESLKLVVKMISYMIN